MLTDIEIAQQCKMKPITEIAAQLGIAPEELEPYGHYKAKLSDDLAKRLENKPDGKLILVTAINPTPAGEGKTTTTVGLGQAMSKIGKNAIIALREPSLGPVFGIKGGAAGGGYAQVVPMEDINLHFTGDMHAITAANNLLCAILDNHLQQGNQLNIDPRRVLFKRCMDMNDRALRFVNVGLGGKANGVPREDGFQITVASEVMAILCLAADLQDLKERLGNILVAYTYDNRPVYAKRPSGKRLDGSSSERCNQTKPGSDSGKHPCSDARRVIFANIAHGCNSVRATKLALKLADYTITEAGFGSDLGAEKFLDIKCRYAGLAPSAIVVVATLRALKYNGGVPKADTAKPNVEAVKAGLCNLAAHVENMKKYGVPVVVAINHFLTDSDEEVEVLENYCRENDVEFALSDVFAKGGEGGIELAHKVVKACEKPANFAPIYDVDLPIKEKIETIAKTIYGADGVTYSSEANKAIAEIEKLGKDKLPICMAKTQYSLSDDATKLGRPTGFKINIRDVKLSAGAGFIVALSGAIMTMPGLGKEPAAYRIDIDADGNIHGLF